MPASPASSPWRWLPLAAWLGVIAVALSVPDARLPNVPEAAEWAAHVVLFGVAVALALYAVPGRVLWVAGAALLLAVASEVAQERWAEGRGGDLSDVLADVAGIGLGAVAGRRRRAADTG